ncbi:helix-turn-helix domain-containing protein [Pradoshia sp. D12]|uniref:helix-turn-helix domain-containing protein n=1 Tax=Bacillaceae TaxID=186817 RepID=UPI00080AD800|nr:MULTISPECIES: helix-turn-helix domain-containing protein [Bacillaceae]OCA90135.1 transcriptional regulator [Bacillus sp. FJAT-27986]QFK70459.1 helix-turn-helix domain-containing protein [Pradoshia sp. D12]TPF72254.1 helix-turn-helix domain-containing protein [Bacillus sp. D12]
MSKDEIIRLISERMRLIRVEVDYTQDKMAEIIGISKKTLVQIEKERNEASWTTVVAVVSLFRETLTVQTLFGGDPLEVIETVSRERIDYRKEKMLGGKVWWKDILNDGGYVLQQNMISEHYRILDGDQYRIYSSLNENDAHNKYKELVNKVLQ